jgi:pimeloyl-ACP methyl ester carboxylesterase
MISAHVAETMRAITPTLPGWNGTERPDWLTSIDAVASAFLQYLEDQDLTDVLVIGSSIGGWIGAEMAARDTAARIGGLVLIDAVGIDVPGQPITDFFALDPRGIAEHSFHDSERFYMDPAAQPPEQLATIRSNLATLRVIAGDPYMHDPKLRERLAGVSTPTLAIWGGSDAIVNPDYGRSYAGSFPNARFELVTGAGHLPQIEQPAATFALIDAFAKEGRS